MITLVFRADAHLADEAPIARIDDWAASILDKVVQIGKIAKEVNAQAVIDGGDFFHIKAPSRNTHNLVIRAAAAHAGYPCPVFVTFGNHDAKYQDLDFVGEAPLGVLYETGTFRRLYDGHEALLTDGKLTVRVIGIPYHGPRYEMARFTGITKGPEDYLVAVAHVLASPASDAFFEGEDIIPYRDLATLAPDCWMFGHWHKDQGIGYVGDKVVINPGALSRGALTQDETTRIPGVIIVRFTRGGIETERRALDVRPASEVFDLVGRAKVEGRDMTMEALADTLRTALTMRVTGSLIEEVRNMPDLADPVKQRGIHYLEHAAGAR